jgi:hypothetical protein
LKDVKRWKVGRDEILLIRDYAAALLPDLALVENKVARLESRPPVLISLVERPELDEILV